MGRVRHRGNVVRKLRIERNQKRNRSVLSREGETEVRAGGGGGWEGVATITDARPALG